MVRNVHYHNTKFFPFCPDIQIKIKFPFRVDKIVILDDQRLGIYSRFQRAIEVYSFCKKKENFTPDFVIELEAPLIHLFKDKSSRLIGIDFRNIGVYFIIREYDYLVGMIDFSMLYCIEIDYQKFLVLSEDGINFYKFEKVLESFRPKLENFQNFSFCFQFSNGFILIHKETLVNILNL